MGVDFRVAFSHAHQKRTKLSGIKTLLMTETKAVSVLTECV